MIISLAGFWYDSWVMMFHFSLVNVRRGAVVGVSDSLSADVSQELVQTPSNAHAVLWASNVTISAHCSVLVGSGNGCERVFPFDLKYISVETNSEYLLAGLHLC